MWRGGRRRQRDYGGSHSRMAGSLAAAGRSNRTAENNSNEDSSPNSPNGGKCKYSLPRQVPPEYRGRAAGAADLSRIRRAIRTRCRMGRNIERAPAGGNNLAGAARSPADGSVPASRALGNGRRGKLASDSRAGKKGLSLSIRARSNSNSRDSLRLRAVASTRMTRKRWPCPTRRGFEHFRKAGETLLGLPDPERIIHIRGGGGGESRGRTRAPRQSARPSF